MRITFVAVFSFLALAMVVCTFISMRSKKEIGKYVAFLTVSIIPPIIGNLIVVASDIRALSVIGYYVYFLGMDVIMLSLVRFTFAYCNITVITRKYRYALYGVLAADALQYVLNPFFGQAFSVDQIMVDSMPYFRPVAYAGQTAHRIIDYGIVFIVLFIFIYKMTHSPRIYSEKYSVIVITLVITTITETFFIFSRTPIDRAMVGFGIFGLLIFYFSLYYRPLRLLDRMLANIASGMHQALFFFDTSGKCIWANEPGIAMTGISGNSFEKAERDLREMFGEIRSDKNEWHREESTGRGEERRYYELEMHKVADERGNWVGSFLVITDNTKQKRDFARQLYNANHDPLTGLYTRSYLYEQIRRELSANPDTDYLVAFVDVRNFKIVNDIFGKKFGDYAIQCIAKLISTDISEHVKYGRLAGDTFGACLPVSELDTERIERELSEFTVKSGSIEHHILIHIGIYEIVDKDIEVSVMFDRANMALSTIKEEYRKHIAYYDDKMRAKVLWNQNISGQLQEALKQKQIMPYLQPIMNADGKIAGAEALVRWIHPEQGFMNPGAFIPVFEKNGMIVEVDKYMWRCACEILSKWHETDPDLFISVNISPKDFYFMDVAQELTKLVEEYGIPTSALRVEITETVVMSNTDDRMNDIRKLKEAGFVVEMDDFGSGYSSLNMLKDMPVGVLKIDMKFLSSAQNDERARTILQNVIHLSGDLRIASLTEGVETEEQYRMLSDMGCELFQGYHFSKPIPVAQFEEKYTH